MRSDGIFLANERIMPTHLARFKMGSDGFQCVLINRLVGVPRNFIDDDDDDDASETANRFRTIDQFNSLSGLPFPVRPHRRQTR